MYRDDLMDIYKNPVNKGVLPDADAHSHKKNPMCGDELTLSLKIGDGKIIDAKFDGTACAVSVISASILTEHLKGKTLEEAYKITKDELLELIDLNLTTSRVKCATLVLDALKSALEGVLE